MYDVLEEDYKIENNIPIPPCQMTGKSKYPHMQMEIGQSFYISTRTKWSSAYALARIYGRRSGKVFCSRKEGAGWRIWREK